MKPRRIAVNIAKLPELVRFAASRRLGLSRCDPLATLKKILMFPHERALTAFGLGPTMFEFLRSLKGENSCVFIDLLCVLQSSVLR
jgi:hypothetical protein